jgi:hypothetical protein
MNLKQLPQGVLRGAKVWRLRFYLVAYLSALMTLAAPLDTLTHPPLESAEANVPLTFQGFAAQTGKTLYGWNENEFKCLDFIWTKESNWNPKADNPNSSAYGIAQMLREDSRNGFEQIRNGLRYIEHRYETPCNAMQFWKRKYWY